MSCSHWSEKETARHRGNGAFAITLSPALRGGNDLLRRIGSSAEAAKSYTRALALATNDSERRFLERRLREVEGSLTHGKDT